jgi:hypothetical protein
MAIKQLELFGNSDEMTKGALVDPTGNYRYKLWRDWDKYKPRVIFIMLNERLGCSINSLIVVLIKRID